MEALQEAIGTGSLDQAEMLGRLISRVAALEAAAAESAAQRRALHNQFVELRGNVRAALMPICSSFAMLRWGSAALGLAA